MSPRSIFATLLTVTALSSSLAAAAPASVVSPAVRLRAVRGQVNAIKQGALANPAGRPKLANQRVTTVEAGVRAGAAFSLGAHVGIARVTDEHSRSHYFVTFAPSGGVGTFGVMARLGGSRYVTDAGQSPRMALRSGDEREIGGVTLLPTGHGFAAGGEIELHPRQGAGFFLTAGIGFEAGGELRRTYALRLPFTTRAATAARLMERIDLHTSIAADALGTGELDAANKQLERAERLLKRFAPATPRGKVDYMNEDGI